MKTFIFALTLLLIPSVIQACENTAVTGSPQTSTPGISICRSGYELLYNSDFKTPVWVAEHIEANEVRGKQIRDDKFRSDPEIQDHLEAHLSDYKGSGYARGHMAPVGDFRRNLLEADESFYLSNMVPQIQVCNNSGVWRSIEDITRDWAIHYNELYVVTGPIYSDANTKIIGNGVRVPDALFKVVYNPTLKQTLGFVVPNKELCGSKPRQFVMPVTQIEQLAHMKFFPNISATDATGLWE
jgi:endonuclease G, mitochondrial